MRCASRSTGLAILLMRVPPNPNAENAALAPFDINICCRPLNQATPRKSKLNACYSQELWSRTAEPCMREAMGSTRQEPRVRFCAARHFARECGNVPSTSRSVFRSLAHATPRNANPAPKTLTASGIELQEFRMRESQSSTEPQPR